MAQLFLSLGSNQGSRERVLSDALSTLAERVSGETVTVSPLYETAPVGGPPQDWFLNCVACFSTDANPELILEEIHTVESMFGRERTVQWGPRTIDIDILFYDDLVVNIDTLVIPHPLLHDRLFVLEPLCVIAPDLVHPVLNKTVIVLRDEIQAVVAETQLIKRYKGNSE